MRAFLAFYLPFQIPRLARLPLLTPRTITYDQSLPAKKLAFSTLRPESLTHPGCELPSPVRSQRVPPGHPRAQRGLPVRHGNSETTVGRRREPPGQTALPFQPPARRGLPVQHGDSEITVGRRREPPDRQTFFFHPAAGKAYPTTLPVDCEAFRPLNFNLLSKPVRLGEPRSPDGRQRELSRPDNIIFSSPRSARLTRPTRRS